MKTVEKKENFKKYFANKILNKLSQNSPLAYAGQMHLLLKHLPSLKHGLVRSHKGFFVSQNFPVKSFMHKQYVEFMPLKFNFY